MRSKPYVFFDGWRWCVRWTRPIDGDTRDVVAGGFGMACKYAAALVRRYGLVLA